MPDMRFAPAPVLLARSKAGGLNQMSVRSHNERLVLDLLRREKTLSRFEIGQRTGLSAQTVSVLIRALLKDGLVSEEESSRGRVGPPTTPFSLNPDGAFALGVYVGVKVIDVCVLDFRGNLRGTLRRPIARGDGLGTQVIALAAEVLAGAGDLVRSRCLGLGLGVNKAHWGPKPSGPDEGWSPEAGLGDIENRLTRETGLSCVIVDDATSAAIGQILYGAGDDRFVYCHIGANAQARVVLNGQAQVGFDDTLIALPGMSALEAQLDAAGIPLAGFWMGETLPDTAAPALAAWGADVSIRITNAIIGLLAFLDVPKTVLVAPFAARHLAALAATVDAAFTDRGVAVPTEIGHNAQWAKASGAAAAVMSSRFSQDWHVTAE
ncbi:MarR family transcriptional regulator [Acuticoccus sp. MNP-M23]|uniref:MarR family transcriptional regulator n=1 Tax=Acuticoccus sp. MNP-M23 TaxID=3072793 RepID=UPI0028155E8F|nr:MarR family transcriptional regulator [Acuticoccus sp. MNP-M23]WMS40937.1 MarR family transcriptional regulator [Acuticoccus sp. MNP-M23]